MVVFTEKNHELTLLSRSSSILFNTLASMIQFRSHVTHSLAVESIVMMLHGNECIFVDSQSIIL